MLDTLPFALTTNKMSWFLKTYGLRFYNCDGSKYFRHIQFGLEYKNRCSYTYLRKYKVGGCTHDCDISHLIFFLYRDVDQHTYYIVWKRLLFLPSISLVSLLYVCLLHANNDVNMITFLATPQNCVFCVPCTFHHKMGRVFCPGVCHQMWISCPLLVCNPRYGCLRNQFNGLHKYYISQWDANVDWHGKMKIVCIWHCIVLERAFVFMCEVLKHCLKCWNARLWILGHIFRQKMYPLLYALRWLLGWSFHGYLSRWNGSLCGR